ncbi:MAG: hypothetical protein AB1566_08505 [Chloroflexota bacterium]
MCGGQEALDDKAIAKALITQAQEKKAVRPTWCFYERIAKELLGVLK